MDTGNGSFRQLTQEETKELFYDEPEGYRAAKPGLFRVEEEVEIRGSRFKVLRITKHELHLRLLPRK